MDSIPPAPELFCVIQYFENNTMEKVREYVSAEEAIKAFKHYTDNVTAKLGVTVRVIIVDQLDCVNAEWIYGKGITFPTEMTQQTTS